MRTGQEAFTIQHVAVDKCAPSQSRHTESKHLKLGNEYPDVMMLVSVVILLSSAPCVFSIVFALPHKIGRYRVSTCPLDPNHLLCSRLLLLRGAAAVAAGDLLPLVPGPGHLALPAAGRRQGGGAPAARHQPPAERGGERPHLLLYVELPGKYPIPSGSTVTWTPS